MTEIENVDITKQKIPGAELVAPLITGLFVVQSDNACRLTFTEQVGSQVMVRAIVGMTAETMGALHTTLSQAIEGHKRTLASANAQSQEERRRAN